MRNPLIDFDVEDAVREAVRLKVQQQLALRCYRVILAARCAEFNEVSDYRIQWKDLELVRQGFVKGIINFPYLDNYRFLEHERQIQVFDEASGEWMLIGDPHEAYLSIVPNIYFSHLNMLNIEVRLRGTVKTVLYSRDGSFTINGSNVQFPKIGNINAITVPFLDNIHDLVLKYLESRSGLDIFTTEHAIVQSHLELQFDEGEIKLALNPLSLEDNELHLIFDADTKKYGFAYKGMTYDLNGNTVGYYSQIQII